MPIFHLGAVGGIRPPFWDQRDEFGDTNMLVIKPEEGASLARALGSHWMVLMMRHGVTVAGTDVRDCVFRSVFSARNAEYQVRAMTIGSEIATLSPGEAKLASQISSKTTGLIRSWEYWSMRVANKSSGGLSSGAAHPPGRQKRAAPTLSRAKTKRARAGSRAGKGRRRR